MFRLGANHFITSAKLCVRNVYAPTVDTAIMCKEVLKDWDPETITYENRPEVSGVYQDYCRVVKNQYSWKRFFPIKIKQYDKINGTAAIGLRAFQRLRIRFLPLH